MKYSCNITYTSIQIDSLSEIELYNISTKFCLKLPQNKSLNELLKTLFYLDLYVKLYKDIAIAYTEEQFFNLIWSERIKGKLSKRGMALKREEVFLEVIHRRITTGEYYLDKTGLDQEALYNLISDEILGLEQNDSLYFTHDIYEEWGIYRIISYNWLHKKNVYDFFDKIGESYIVRRIFRQWLSDKINMNINEI